MSDTDIEKLNTRCAAIEHVVSALVRQLNERQKEELFKEISASVKKYNDPELSSLATRLGSGV
ncbi:TPA: hypothetical protein ACIBE2_004805 [Salmonella enterica subsp. diarizonae serovar 61:r:-]